MLLLMQNELMETFLGTLYFVDEPQLFKNFFAKRNLLSFKFNTRYGKETRLSILQFWMFMYNKG